MAARTAAKPLTARGIEALASDPVARREIADGGAAGLFLVVQPSGARGWAFRYRHEGKPRKLTLGAWPRMGLADARRAAERAADAVAHGDDPAAAHIEAKRAAKAEADADPERDLVRGIVEEFVKRHCALKKDGAETARLLRKNALPTLGDRRLDTLTRRDVVTMLDALVDRGAPYTANRTFAAFRKCCNWAVQRGVIEASPCLSVRAPAPEVRRDRVLTDAELRWLWVATETLGPPFGPLVRLLLLTGQRRAEVAGMTDAELDRAAGLWTIPGVRAKNARAHVVPLSDAALAALASQPRIAGSAFIFSASGRRPFATFGHAKEQLDAAMLAAARAEAAAAGADPEAVQIAPWRLHDLRRTAASGMARAGADVATVERMLNHISGVFSGVTGVYQRHDFADEMRRAADAWAAHLLAVVEPGRGDNVVRLRAAQ